MTSVTVDEVKFRLESGEQLNLIDVREPYEHAEFNIGGILVPLGKVQTMQIDDIAGLRNEEVIVYCRSGNRSGQAALMLETFGFSNVKTVVGGLLAWKERFGG